MGSPEDRNCLLRGGCGLFLSGLRKENANEMSQGSLLELTYFDSKSQVRLTTYADTIITDPNGKEESITAVRCGRYPEMVRAMSDTICGCGSIDLIQNGNIFQLKSKLKSRKCYIFCPDGDRDSLFAEVDRKTAAPLLLVPGLCAG